MQDLIDRNALIEELKQTKFPCMLPSGIDYLEGIQTAVTRITGIINDAVQVELESVRRGRWIDSHMISGGDFYRCSECGCYIEQIYFANDYNVRYCPNCGSKMDFRTPTESAVYHFADASKKVGGVDNG